MLNDLYLAEDMDTSALFFRLNANVNLEVSDYELKHAFDLDVSNEQHYKVVDTIVNERDNYRIEYMSNGNKTYDRIVQIDNEATVPLWKQKKDLRIKLLSRMKQSRADISVFRTAKTTVVSIREKRVINKQLISAKQSIRKFEGLLAQLSTV